MKLKFNLTIVTIVLVFQNMYAQQLPLYQFYRDHWGLVNPAGVSSNYLGYERAISINASVRQQWLKIPEAPKTQILSFEYIHDDNHISTGGYIINDQTGAIGQTGIYGNFAYRIPIGNDDHLAAGISLGGVQYQLDLGEILSGADNTNALGLENVNTNQLHYDVGLGAMLYLNHNNRLSSYYGISAPQTFALNTAFKTGTNEYSIIRQRHIYLTTGLYRFFDETKYNFLECTLWGRYLPNAPISVDANVRYHMRNNDSVGFWFGIGGGLSKIIQAEFGVGMLDLGRKRNILRLGVGYSQYLSKLDTGFGQTLDFTLSFALQK